MRRVAELAVGCIREDAAVARSVGRSVGAPSQLRAMINVFKITDPNTRARTLACNRRPRVSFLLKESEFRFGYALVSLRVFVCLCVYTHLRRRMTGNTSLLRYPNFHLTRLLAVNMYAPCARIYYII